MEKINEKKMFVERKEIRDKIKEIVERQMEYGLRSWEYHGKKKEPNEWIIFRKQVSEAIRKDVSLFLDNISVSKYLSKEWTEIRSKERKGEKGKLAKMVKEKQLFDEIKKEVEEKEGITVWKIIQHKYHLMGIGGVIIMSVNEDRLYNT